MTDSHRTAVTGQFGPQAKAYLESAVHRAGPDLDEAKRLVAALPASNRSAALDVGCGAGHLSLTLAPHIGAVTLVDPAAAMLQVAAEAGRAAGHAFRTVEATADRLPFDAHAFPLVMSRYSAHHWPDLSAALAELHRVTRPGGHLLMIDTLPMAGAVPALVDTHVQTIELLRDRSHVRDYSAGEWRRALAAAGFRLVAEQTWPLRLAFVPWVTRMRTDAERVAMLRTLLDTAPAEVRAALEVGADRGFTLATGLFLAEAQA